MPCLSFFVINLFRNKLFASNQLNFESNLCTNQQKFKVAKVKKSLPILRFAEEMSFRNLRIFWTMFNLNDVIKRICDVNILT